MPRLPRNLCNTAHSVWALPGAAKKFLQSEGRLYPTVSAADRQLSKLPARGKLKSDPHVLIAS